MSNSGSLPWERLFRILRDSLSILRGEKTLFHMILSKSLQLCLLFLKKALHWNPEFSGFSRYFTSILKRIRFFELPLLYCLVEGRIWKKLYHLKILKMMFTKISFRLWSFVIFFEDKTFLLFFFSKPCLYFYKKERLWRKLIKGSWTI